MYSSCSLLVNDKLCDRACATMTFPTSAFLDTLNIFTIALCDLITLNVPTSPSLCSRYSADTCIVPSPALTMLSKHLSKSGYCESQLTQSFPLQEKELVSYLPVLEAW
jgi:hypothetical protein